MLVDFVGLAICLVMLNSVWACARVARVEFEFELKLDLEKQKGLRMWVYIAIPEEDAMIACHISP